MPGNFTREMKCPWCGKGKTLADGRAQINLSLVCPRCGRYFIGNLDNLRTERSSAVRRQGHHRK